MNKQIKLQALTDSALLEGLGQETLKEIAEFTEYLRFEDGEQALWEHGDPPKPALWLLASGDVEVGVSFSVLKNAEKLAIRKVDAELYGEISWLLDSAPTAGVTCKGRTDFLKIDGQALNQFMEKHPKTAALLLRRIGEVMALRVINLTHQKRDEALWQF